MATCFLFIGLEEAAAHLREFHTDLVSGVLQTREYATAVFSMNQVEVPVEEIERRVEVRMRRARLLTRMEPYLPRFDIVLDEAILRRPIGSPEIMATQLRRLAQAGELPNVSIRVLPFSAGLHAGLMAHGSFTLLDFPEGNEPTTVYVAGRSLSDQASRDLFWRLAKEFEA